MRPFYKNFGGRQPLSRKEEQEYGPGKKDIVMCPDCNSTYYEKRWHHSLANYKQRNADKNIRFEVCPADRMRRDNVFEGEIQFVNVPNDSKEEMMRQVNNLGKQFYERDPMDRILSIQETNAGIIVRTSENQTALAIAKHIHNARKKTILKSSFSEGESPIRMQVVWSEGNE